MACERGAQGAPGRLLGAVCPMLPSWGCPAGRMFSAAARLLASAWGPVSSTMGSRAITVTQAVETHCDDMGCFTVSRSDSRRCFLGPERPELRQLGCPVHSQDSVAA